MTATVSIFPPNFLPILESPRNRYANSYPLDQRIIELNRTNLLLELVSPISILFRLPSPLFPTPIGDPSFGIQLSAIRNVETGQRVNPIALPIRVVAVILKINEWGEKDSRQPRKYKSQYGRQV